MTDGTAPSDGLARWIRSYRRAWESNDPVGIRALFTDDADYFEAPHEHPWHGHDAIVAGWLAARDEPGDTEFEWELVAETPDAAVVRAVSTYAAGPVYDNLWVIRLAPDGRATSYMDWWIERPAPEETGAGSATGRAPGATEDRTTEIDRTTETGRTTTTDHTTENTKEENPA